MDHNLTTNIRKAADLIDALTDLGQQVIGLNTWVSDTRVDVHVHRMLLDEAAVQRLCHVAGLDHRVDPVSVLTYTTEHDAEVYDFPGVRVFTLTPLSSPVGTFDPDVTLVQDCESVGA